MEWIILLAAIIASVCITYVVLRPRMIATQEADEKTAQENAQLKAEYELSLESKRWIEKEMQQLQAENKALNAQKISSINEIATLNQNIIQMEKQAQEAADQFYQSKIQLATEKFERDLQIEEQKYKDNIQNFEIEYQANVAALTEQYKLLEGNVATMQALNDAAVAAAKRAEEMKSQQDFYRIQLAASDLHEIELLRQVEPYLRDKEPLNKVIWKCYYEKPTTDMIGRVIGSGIHTGIYKITEIASGKCYVGQAANLSERWKQHIKRGVGAETPTRNKLYPAMIAHGPENFTFEVIEECDRSLLDQREDYWQDYFKAKEFGYSIK